MPITDPTMSQVEEFKAVKAVRCDACDRVIDLMDKYAYQDYLEGTLYNGELLCWKCTEEAE